MAIVFNPNQKVFSLHTEHTTYQMMIDDYGYLLHLYYGERNQGMMDYALTYADRGFSGNPYVAGNNRSYSLDSLPQEYPTLGTGDFRNYALDIKNSDGSECCDLKYSGYKIRKGKYQLKWLPAAYAEEEEAQTLELVMKDEASGIEVSLLYGVLEGSDVITRSAIIRNHGKGKVFIEKAAAACLDFLYGEYDIISFHGKHAMERMVQRTPVGYGTFSFGSRRGTSSHQYNPSVILAERNATEDTGRCYGMLFVYSGNFLCEIEKDQIGQTRALLGLSDELFSYPLQAGEAFTVPEAILSYSGEGLSKLSMRFHRCIRSHVCRGKYNDAGRPVLINSWEAAYFDFTGETIVKLAGEAASLGIDMVVMDDGWFGKRNDDNTSLGDWKVNEEKLGCSLGELIRRVHEKGVKFGIWIEPEMVNEDSDLYRAHPDWIIQIPGRKPVRSRNQLLLDFSRKEVRDAIFDEICAVLDQGQIDYVKWDMNRSMTDVYAGNVAYDYMLGVYEFLERFVARYPDILLEGCSGGGGRFDAGMLAYASQIWCSDNTDAINRISIQYGTSFFYPASAVGSHVSAVPNHQTGRVTSLNTRGVVAMAGTFGYEMNPGLLGEEEKEKIREQVKTYKKYEMLVRKGDYYRLSDPFTDEIASWMFVAEDRSQALVSGVRLKEQGNMAATYLRLKGLKKEAMYLMLANGRVYQGASLMEIGLPLPFPTIEYEAGMFELLELKTPERLFEILRGRVLQRKERTVISIFGGSGCGKTTLAEILLLYFLNEGIGCYKLSGDDYPHLIPKENDEKRQEILESSGEAGLREYLGTPQEIAFEEINGVLASFHEGETPLRLRKLGREKGQLHYEETDVQDVKVLLVEWTHGGSEYLKGADIKVYLDSTPEETLGNRLRRGRDDNAGSSLIRTVLEIEQEKLLKQASSADIVVSRNGGVQENVSL